MNMFYLRVVLGALAVLCFAAAFATADDVCCAPAEPAVVAYTVAHAAPAAPSWIFRPSTFTHDPMTGARVAQYMRKTPVEPLDDERAVTSNYRRTRTNLRGTDGSIDSYYQVQAWNNGRGGLDAEWERFHDAWKESILTGGNYDERTRFHGGDPRWNQGWGNGWNGGWGGGPGWNGGWNNGPGWNGGPNWNPGWNNGGGWNGGWQNGPGGGGWNNGHDNDHHGGWKDKKVYHHGDDE